LGQVFAAELASGANRRGNVFGGGAWNELNQLAVATHPSRSFQLERLSIPNPRKNSPQPVSLFSPAREHESLVHDRNL
jgi:hypothetical protein